MFPPPGSYLPPPSSGSVPQAATPSGGMLPLKIAEMNQAVQQMHGMKIDDALKNKIPGPLSTPSSLPPVDSMNYNSTHSLPSSMGIHPSQNMNRAASTTKVTFSPQPRATYPYSPQGSTGGNAPPAPNSVPSAKTLSSSASYITTHNGTSGSASANTDGRNGVLNGEFSDPRLMQAQLHSSGPPSSLLAKQNLDLNRHSDRPAKSSMLISQSHPGAPNERTSYGPPGVPSGQMPYTSGGLTAYHAPGTPNTTAPYRPLGTPNTQTLYSPAGALGAHTYNAPGAPSMPTPHSHLGASNRLASQNLPLVPSGMTSNSVTSVPGPKTHNPSIPPSGPAPHSSPGVPSGPAPYASPSGPAPYSSSGIPSGQGPYSPSGTPSGPGLYSNPSGTSSGPAPNSPLGTPSGLSPFSPPGVSIGSALYSPVGAPSGPTSFSPPGAPSGPTSFSPPGAPSGRTSFSPPGIPSGPTSFSPPGIPSGPTSFSPPGAPSGPTSLSPPGIPSGPYSTPGPGISSGQTSYNPIGAPHGQTPYSPSGVPGGPAQYNVPGTPSGPVQYSHLGSPGGPLPYSPHGISQAQTSLQQQQQQQQRKLELDQMPSTVQVREEDKRSRSGYYPTDTKCIPPPLVTTNFTVQDRGVCSPRFIRSTMYCLPNSPDILKQTGIPFAIVVDPMASVCDGENEPPLCLHREDGPLRCKRCKAYMCSFMTFGEGGRCFQCAFCKVATEVPQDYFCYLDGTGQRTDKFHRPELCLGSYEFIATKDYCKNGEQPNPPAYIFMLEVSKSTQGNGMVSLLCQNMKNILSALHGDEKKKTSSAKVGFVTYNNVLHFYNLKKSLSQPHIMVMPDVHDAFVPLLDGFLVSVTEAEALIDSLMEQIPQMYTNEPSGEVLFGPVVQAGLEALKNANCAGKLLIFHSTLPTCDAPGKLQKRDGQKLLGTEKQKTVLTPQNPLYNKLAEECVAAGCCVDLFLFPNDYIDVASMSPLCRHTGGHMYKYMYFQSQTDGNRFLEDLERNVTTPTAFDAVLRIRTSAGISPVFHYGNFFMSNATDIEISAVNSHKAATVELAYDEKLTENDTVYIQAALLYTTCNGDRRIRVHNLAFSTSSSVADMYRGCELDTIVNFLSKQGLKQMYDQPPQQAKSALVSRAVKMLSGYRKHCSSASSSSQLILPETLKLLPLYINCMLKSDALTGGPEILLDDRSFSMLAVNGMHVGTSALYFYPVLISLHDLDLSSDEMPVPMRCSIEKLCNDGAYLLTNGVYMFLWIGQGITPEWVGNVFGVQSPSAIDKQQSSLMELDNPLSKRICHIIEDLEEMSLWYMRLNILLQGDKLEIVFRQFLVEDRGVDGSPAYVEFVCHLHKEIAKLL